MFRHRKRLIAKRLSKLMKKKNQKYLKQLFAKFLQSRLQQTNNILPLKSKQSQLQYDQQPQSEQIINQQNQADSQFSIFDYIETLSQHEKKIFKLENPDLPQTFFMSKKQKRKYFSKKNTKFQIDLKNTPVRCSKNSNHVQFKEKFSYKPFSDKDKAIEIKKAKQLNAGYNNKIHHS